METRWQRCVVGWIWLLICTSEEPSEWRTGLAMNRECICIVYSLFLIISFASFHLCTGPRSFCLFQYYFTHYTAKYPHGSEDAIIITYTFHMSELYQLSMQITKNGGVIVQLGSYNETVLKLSWVRHKKNNAIKNLKKSYIYLLG